MHVPNISNPNLAAFTKRLDAITKPENTIKLEQLRNDPVLKKLLPKLIAHLAVPNDSKDSSKLKDAEHIAHFLMGRKSDLPQGLKGYLVPENPQNLEVINGNAYVIQPETKQILDDAFRTHRYLFTEDATKTLAKLQRLNQVLNPQPAVGDESLFSKNPDQLLDDPTGQNQLLNDADEDLLPQIVEERKEDSDEEQPQDNTNKQIQIPRKLLNQGQWLSQSGYHILDDENDMTSKLYKSNVDKQDQCKKQQDKKKQAIQSKKAQQKQSQIRQEENQSQIKLEEEQLQIKKSLLNKSAAKKINEQTILKKSEAKKINEQSGLKQSLLEKSRLNQSMLSSGFEVVELSANAKKAREVNQLIADLIAGTNVTGKYPNSSDGIQVQVDGPLNLGDADQIIRKFIKAALGIEPSLILKPNEGCNERVYVFECNGLQVRLGCASGSYETGNLLTMLAKADELEGKLKVPTLNIIVGGAYVNEQVFQKNKFINHAMLLVQFPGKDKFTEVDPKSNLGRAGSAPNIIPAVKGERPQVAKDYIEEKTVAAGLQSLLRVDCVRNCGTLGAIIIAIFLTKGELAESVADICKDTYDKLDKLANGGNWFNNLVEFKAEANAKIFANTCQKYPDSKLDIPLEVIDIGLNFDANHTLLELDMSEENLQKSDDINIYH